MKRIAALLASAALLLSLVACGGSTSTTPVASVSTGTDSSATSNSTAASSSETVEEAVLLDQNGIKVTAKGFDKNGIMGPELKLLVENNSDKNVTVQTRAASVNGYMVETIFSCDLVAGKKSNESLVFMSSAVKACGIDTFADMEFSFHVFDTASFNDYFDSEPVVVKTSAADTYTYTFDDSGTPVYEGGGIKIVAKGLVEGGLLGPGVSVYISNESGKSMTVQSRDVSVNGFMIDPVFSCEVAPGKHALSEVTFLSSMLQDNSITKIETVELSFHIFDTNDWMASPVDTDVITLTF